MLIRLTPASSPWVKRKTAPWYSPSTFSRYARWMPPYVTSPNSICPANRPSLNCSGVLGELAISFCGSHSTGLVTGRASKGPDGLV
ncbi:hypothetical protein SCALM49S_01944 [Streptomyces californicus]